MWGHVCSLIIVYGSSDVLIILYLRDASDKCF